MSRLRANKITNQLADGSPTVEKGLIIAGVTTVTTLDLAEKIVHTGDTDTYLQFTANTINLHSGGTTGLTVLDSSVRVPTKLGINGAAPQVPLDIIANGSGYAVNVRGRSSDNVGEIRFTSNNYGSLYSVLQTGATYLNFQVGSTTNALRITSSGKVLIGSTNHNTTIGSGVGSQLQIEGNTYQTSGLALINNSTSTDPAFIIFGKSRAGTAGGTTAVQNGDRLGGIRFSGADGSDLHSRAAQIEVYVDGTPGGDDLPGRIVMETTPDGSPTPTNHLILYGSTKEIRNAGHYVAQTSGSGTSSQTASFGATQSGMAADSYNYILSGSNNIGNKCTMFVNGSNRSVDGGTNALTFRNDAGNLNLGHNSYLTTLRGSYVLYPERPAFHVTNFTWSNSTKFAHGGTATYNRGSHWNVSTGTFTAPVAGDYIMFCSVQVHAPNEITGRNATYSNLYAEKNGSNIGGEIVGTCQVGSYAFHGTLTHSLVVNLAQNDTFRWNSSYGFRYGQNTLYGYLLG